MIDELSQSFVYSWVITITYKIVGKTIFNIVLNSGIIESVLRTIRRSYYDR